VVIDKLKSAVNNLATFMQSHGLDCAPEQVANLKGDSARAEFINHFKEVQRLKTQLDQYTDLGEEHKDQVEVLLPEYTLARFKGVYLDTAQRLKAQQGIDNGGNTVVQQLDLNLYCLPRR
jgi:type I restriction enzyme, R subunit